MCHDDPHFFISLILPWDNFISTCCVNNDKYISSNHQWLTLSPTLIAIKLRKKMMKNIVYVLRYFSDLTMLQSDLLKIIILNIYSWLLQFSPSPAQGIWKKYRCCSRERVGDTAIKLRKKWLKNMVSSISPSPALGIWFVRWCCSRERVGERVSHQGFWKCIYHRYLNGSKWSYIMAILAK